MIMRLLVLGLLVMTFPVAAQQEIYKWTDAQGHTHFASQPPENIPAEPLNLSPQPVTVTAGEKVYTWTDEQGNTHYGDRPPVSVQAEQLDTNAVPMSTIRATEFRSGERQLLHQLEQNKR
jgi:hypothetical protein